MVVSVLDGMPFLSYTHICDTQTERKEKNHVTVQRTLTCGYTPNGIRTRGFGVSTQSVTLV